MKIKMVQYGCGKMSGLTMRYAVEKGVKIVGAFDIDENLIGKDIGEVIGDGKTYKVKVQDAKDFESFLKAQEVDVAIVTTRSLFSECYDALEICAKNGVNAITTCEEAFYPQNSNPKLFKKLDKIAQENGATISGSGYQDVYWGNLISVIAGSTHKISSILGKSSYNVEDYGVALAEAHGAGLTVEEFEKQVASADNITDEERKKLINSGKFLPCYMWNVNGWLCGKLGLNVTRQTQKCMPVMAESDIFSSTLNMKIKKGMVRGMRAIVTTQTKEGVVIESECIGKVYSKQEFDCNDWTIKGEPDTRVVIERPATAELTCASTINRIPEVLCCPAGYITTDFMQENFYKNLNLDKYFEEAHCCDCEGDCGNDHECNCKK